ncbi:hypothetical protein EU528_09200 [Candidatus Thorarchaeota archaeon]|nr:MAG: hypothetical protein EU528_09200 [Candidatus Thorarchaeota archaeon]
MQYLKGAVAHIFLLIVNFCVLLGIMMSAQILASPSTDLPILNALLLGYMVVHTSILLSIQLGVQVSELLKKKLPILLITYYFSYDDHESIPEPILDPIRSKIAVLIILLIISGGVVLYPIFAIVGMLLLWVRLPIIVLNPAQVITYFTIFLNLVPPLLLITVAIIVVSIIMIEFKRQ